ncbi:cysteine dioxygenase family protein [Pontibacillus sp. HMF3514]|uniref:cysteine dioxygenase n=1 Tax=Pontibacillus sp. HMF3514 TaxID=2692425 RepID=UPI00131FD4B3|nr:cysteine dioxygenase family protein [Pontibacillus sp. HMF3514]QHE51891.1 hypothetical protein GS400_07530 [Pontibacillus sp. HMF3514]
MERLEKFCSTLLSKSKSLTPKKILSTLEDHPITYVDVQSSIEKETEGYAYGRKTLHRTDDVEILLLYWPPGVSSPIHDHGESYGVVHVVQGDILNENFRKVDEGKVALIEKEYGCESDTVVSYFGDIHRLSNQAEHPCISLHVYSPPLVEMGVYELIENDEVSPLG